MAGQLIIAGFSSTDRIPGFYGETKYGAGGLSAASVPLMLLLVGLKSTTAGTATVDRDVIAIYSPSDADVAFGAGSELARMCYAALQIPGVQLYAAAVSAAPGAIAATATITVGGTWNRVGSWIFRFAGQPVSGTISASDTPQQVAESMRDAVNGRPTLPFTAAAAAGPNGTWVVTLTCVSPGIRGNQHIVFQDSSALPAGCTSVLAGGPAVTGGGIPLSGGTGAEDVTTLLGNIFASAFDRIACAENDAANLGRWRTQLAAQASPVEGKLQHFITGVNGTLAAATTLAQTTLNDQRFQVLWYLNSETHPSEIAAVFGAIRTAREQDDPAAAYDGEELLGVAPQSQRADWPQHRTLIAAVNSGVSPVETTPDGKARLVISITSHSLNGATPDYSTFNTCDAVVPDFVRRDLSLRWLEFKRSNPRVADNPPPGERARPSGVATPDLWNSVVEAVLYDYEEGKIGGTQIAPIIINVGQHRPVSIYEKATKRLMSAVTVEVAPPLHQIGCSVRQVA